MLSQMLISTKIRRSPPRRSRHGRGINGVESKEAPSVNKKDMGISKSRSSPTMGTDIKGKATGTTNTVSRARDSTTQATKSRVEMKNCDFINSMHILMKLNYGHINTISFNQSSSIFLFAFTLATWQTFPMVKLSAKTAPHIFLQLEREDFDWILADRAYITFSFLTNVASVEVLAQYFIITL